MLSNYILQSYCFDVQAAAFSKIKIEPIFSSSDHVISLIYPLKTGLFTQVATELSALILRLLKVSVFYFFQGQPIFKSTDQCVYKFEWKTYEVCDEDEKVDEKKCTIKDNDSGNLFDLSPLKKKNKRDYVVS